MDCYCLAMDSDMVPRATWAVTSPWPLLAGIDTNYRLLLSTLNSPISSLFIIFKLLLFLFHLITTYIVMAPTTAIGWWAVA